MENEIIRSPSDELQNYLVNSQPVENEMLQDATESEFRSLSLVFLKNKKKDYYVTWFSYDRKFSNFTAK